MITKAPNNRIVELLKKTLDLIVWRYKYFAGIW